MEIIDEIALIVVRPGEDELRATKKRAAAAEADTLLAERRRLLTTRLRQGMTDDQFDSDPLLTTLAGLRRQRLEAEMTSRLLVAYGREFVRPRPYRLVDLADATGMSISGLRTAYSHDEIVQVAKVLRRKPSPTVREGESE
jgi:hypothetical protein